MSKKSKKQKKSYSFTQRQIIAFIAILGFAIYANTLGHDFTLDDAIVISDNEFTQKGFGGLADIFTKDTFHGFFGEAGKDKLVSGGRYRPFTLAMFAVEHAIFGNSPFVHHLVNILLYILLGVVVFLCSKKLFQEKFEEEEAKLLAIGLSVLFIAHPIHTEAVANIKGRDEIMALLGSISALYVLVRKQFDNLKSTDYFLSAAIFLIALLSKENAITFVVVAPLSAWMFFQKPMKALLPFLASAIVFMIIRTAVIGFDLGAAPSGELMNNPYLKISEGRYIPFTGSEKLATIFFTLWKYIQLLLFPYPLTHDYYPNHIAVKTFSNPLSILGLLSYLMLAVISVYGILKKKTWAFFTAFYIVTISIVSNIVFPIGTHMSERFVFMPSIAYTGLLSLVLIKAKRKFYLASIALIAIIFSILTISRNQVWKDNFTLFTTDAVTSKNSAKVNNAAGGVISDYVRTMEEGEARSQLIEKGQGHLDNAIAAHPNYVNAYLLKGNLYFYENKFNEAIQYYDTALRIDPNYTEAINNKFLALRSAGRFFGEKMNDLQQSSSYLLKAVAIRPNDFETNRLLGICYGIMGNHSLAVKYFKKCSELEADNADIFVNLARAYEMLGDIDLSSQAAARAQELKAGQ